MTRAKPKNPPPNYVPPERLVRLSDISQRTGVPVNTLKTWAFDRPYLGFPEPVVPASGRGTSHLYDWADYQKWAIVHRPETLMSESEEREVISKRRHEKVELQKRKAFKQIEDVPEWEIKELLYQWRKQGDTMAAFMTRELGRRGYRWWLNPDDPYDHTKDQARMEDFIRRATVVQRDIDKGPTT